METIMKPDPGYYFADEVFLDFAFISFLITCLDKLLFILAPLFL